jgi:hypothetical protein
MQSLRDQCEEPESHFGKEINPSACRDHDGNDKQDNFKFGWERPLVCHRGPGRLGNRFRCAIGNAGGSHRKETRLLRLMETIVLN